MKILVTGRPGAGKSLFAKHLTKQYPDFTIIELDQCGLDRKWFYTSIKNTQNCIVVIQHKKFIEQDIEFDNFYECTRLNDDIFQVNDGLNIENIEFDKVSY
ncbi:AAA family ATPase [Acinetobacter wuhouensis]|uniref:AAA family ATPase n=1 Tax=Acinetobacter wuhouensis TaxID=1879050 RepID=UPI001023E019|nr:AAA family ATPase [Acinetobacter wuhouensis]RZG66682.1 AAA family ATPase [Acinetobacter wuhouensis]